MAELILQGEFKRRLDDRCRVVMPSELNLDWGRGEWMLAKERPGCLSLWEAAVWKQRLEANVELIKQKIAAGKLADRLAEVQLLGRLLSTRYTPAKLEQRNRLLIPEGFREFLGVEPGGDLFVVGAAVCVELWSPAAWNRYLMRRMPRFNRLIESLSR